MANGDGNGKASVRLWIPVITAMVMMAGWQLAETTALKERMAKGEAERERNRDILTDVSSDLREIRADVKKLLERREGK